MLWITIKIIFKLKKKIWTMIGHSWHRETLSHTWKFIKSFHKAWLWIWHIDSFHSQEFLINLGLLKDVFIGTIVVVCYKTWPYHKLKIIFQQNCNLRQLQSRLIVRASPFAMGNEAQQNPPIMPWCPCTKRYSSDSGEISVSP